MDTSRTSEVTRLTIHAGMTVLEVAQRWPTTRAVFGRFGIPVQTSRRSGWESIEQAAAAHGYWTADQLLAELNQIAGGETDIEAHMPVLEVVTTRPATQAIFERHGILCQADRIAPWETLGQAAAARGHWAAGSLLEALNRVCTGEVNCLS
jgi:hypothetical protein